MSNQQSTVTFRVAGNDVMSYMDKMKQKADQMTADMMTNARKQSETAKGQLKDLEAQIKAMERKSRIEIEAGRQVAGQNRDAQKQKNEEEHNARVEGIINNRGLSTKRRERLLGEADETFKAKNSVADSDAREQLKLLREQERQAALTARLMRENVEAIRTTSNQEVIQMRRGDESLLQELDDTATPVQTLAREMSQQRYQEEQDRDKDEADKEKKNRPESTMGALLKAMAFEKGLGLVSQMPQARNELDFVKPILSMLGMGIGGVMGNLVDAANAKVLGTGLGNTSFGALGTALGEKAGEFFGSSLERSYKGRDELTTSNFRLQALTGQDQDIDSMGGMNGLGGTGMSRSMANLEAYGQSFKQTSELQYKIAVSQGNANNLGRNSENAIAASRALAVSEETSVALMEMRRQYSGDVLKLIGGIALKGSGNIFQGDRTFLNEFIGKNFLNLQRELLRSNQDNVSTGATFDILKRFDSIGGAFSARDNRSGGLISSINQSLVNPNSDSMKAYSFLALRKSNPGMGIADLMAEREKGLSSPIYMKSMMDMINKMGGDDQMKRLNIAGAFGINAGAAKKLFENQGVFNGAIDQGELSGTGEYGQDNIRGLGQAQTSRYTKSTAEIENAFVKDVAGAISLVGVKMKDLFGDMIGELKDYITGQFKDPATGLKKNVITNNKSKRVEVVAGAGTMIGI